MTYRTLETGAAPRRAIIDDITLEHIERARHLALSRTATDLEAVKRAESERRKAKGVARQRWLPALVSLHEDAGGTLLRFRHRRLRPVKLALSLVVSIVVALVLGLSLLLATADPCVGLTLASAFGGPLAIIPAMTIYEARTELRPVHLYLTRSGRFVVYEKNPHAPIAVGRAAELSLYVSGNFEVERSVEIRRDGDQVVECVSLLPRDVALIERFARKRSVKIR